jgi:hypothetical protein
LSNAARDFAAQLGISARFYALATALLERERQLGVQSRQADSQDFFGSLAVRRGESQLVLSGREADRDQPHSGQLAQPLADQLRQPLEVGLARERAHDSVQILQLRQPVRLRLVEARVLDCHRGLRR